MGELPNDPDFVKEGARKISSHDIETVVQKSDEIEKRFRNWGPLQRFVSNGRLLLSAVRDYWTGRYRRFPLGTVGAIAFTLLYVFDPLDIVPDVLPIIGQIDDAAVVAACLFLVENDLHTYAVWKLRQPGQPALPAPGDSTGHDGAA